MIQNFQANYSQRVYKHHEFKKEIYPKAQVFHRGPHDNFFMISTFNY